MFYDYQPNPFSDVGFLVQPSDQSIQSGSVTITCKTQTKSGQNNPNIVWWKYSSGMLTLESH